MKRRLWASAAALLGLLAVNLHLCCAVSFGGEALAERCSPAALRRGLAAARAAVGELLPGQEAAVPTLRWGLSLRPAAGESRSVADAALRATPGVAVYDAVYLGETPFGAVENGARFAGRVQAWLFDSMPWRAYDALFTEPFSLRPVYTRADAAREPAALLEMLARTATVLYVDAEGRDVPG